MEMARSFWKRYSVLANMIVLAILVFICYGFVLHLPFFFDDLPTMTWINHHGWHDILHSQDSGYYRPLIFMVCKLGTLLPLGARQVALHGVNLGLHWFSAVLVFCIMRLCDKRFDRAFLAAALFVVFPFLNEAVPWITALSHLLVVALTLLATYLALKAELTQRLGYWGFSLLATALAPLAHESGVVTGVIVGGVVLLQCGFRSRRRWVLVVCGGLLNVVAWLWHSFVPGACTGMELGGLPDLFQNLMFFLQGLLYPVGPLIGLAVQRWGWHDFTLLGVTGGVFAGYLVWLARHGGDRRWIARNLWWWVWGALPAAVSLKYGVLFISERLYTLAAPGIVMLWAAVIIEMGRYLHRAWSRSLVVVVLAGMLLTQNFVYLHHKGVLYEMLQVVHQQVLSVAANEENAPLGFVNVPAFLIWERRTYPLVTDNVVFVPHYSNIGEFIEVNQGWQAADTATFGSISQETDPIWVASVPSLEGEAIRRFVLEHRTIWLSRYDEHTQHFVLLEAGAITPDAKPLAAEPLARFEGGPTLESAAMRPEGQDRWAIVLDWLADGPLDATVFLHVRDGEGHVITQADGASLGGIISLGLWRAGDHIHDVRYVTLPEDTLGPLTISVGVYSGDTRFPAFMGDTRCPDDAVPVGRIAP